MDRYKKLLRSKYVFIFGLIAGLTLAVGVSVWATSIGNNVTVTGTLTTDGASTLTGAATFSGAATFNGNVTLGNAATDVNLFTGTLQASTTALFTSGLTAYGDILLNNFATSTASTGTFNAEGNITTDGSIYATSSIYASSTMAVTGATRLYSTFGVSSTTPSEEVGIVGDVAMGSDATTTLNISSSLVDTGGCINMRNPANNNMFRIYITTGNASSSLRVEAGACQ